MTDFKIIQGDSLESLKTLDSETIRCCVTSPPYWGLRDYGVEGQIGQEKTFEEFIDKLVEVFEEVKRVLTKDGTLWVNMGDSYAGSSKGLMGNGDYCAKTGTKQKTNVGSLSGKKKNLCGFKPKDLIGQPWTLAFALRRAGWYLRQDIIWNKSNPMPESCLDRPTRSHEYLFLLSKSNRYFYDYKAIFEPVTSGPSDIRKMVEGKERIGGKHKGLFDSLFKASATTNIWRKRGVGGSRVEEHIPVGKEGPNSGFHKTHVPGKENSKPVKRFGARGEGDDDNGQGGRVYEGEDVLYRNKRSVWNIATTPYPGAHFATFPKNLVKPCILAGSAPGDTVLDPFSGSGTTGLVATELGRKYVGLELNPEYVKMSEKRINASTPGFQFLEAKA